jgi:hypothetical protein
VYVMPRRSAEELRALLRQARREVAVSLPGPGSGPREPPCACQVADGRDRAVPGGLAGSPPRARLSDGGLPGL